MSTLRLLKSLLGCWLLVPHPLAGQGQAPPKSPLTLLEAVRRGELDAARAAIASGASLETPDQGATPLTAALQAGNLAMVRLLVAKGADIRHASELGSPLWLADSAGESIVFTWNATTTQWTTARAVAPAPMAEYLVSAALNRVKNAPGLAGIRREVVNAVGRELKTSESVIVRLYEVWPDPSVRGAIRVRCDVATGGDFGMLAIVRASGRVFEMLYRATGARAAVSTRAAVSGSEDLDIQLVPDASRRGGWEGIVVNRVPYEQAQAIRHLLESDADVNAKSSNFAGGTPLFAACVIGDGDLVRSLLQRGADPQSSSNNVTALMIGVLNGHTAVVDHLIGKGASLEVKYSNGAGLLFAASQHGHAEVVRSLLKAGMEPNARGPNGSTPLHIAAWKGYDDIVSTLLKNAANAGLKNAKGETALDIARKQGHGAVVQLLGPSPAPGGARPGSRQGHSHAGLKETRR